MDWSRPAWWSAYPTECNDPSARFSKQLLITRGSVVNHLLRRLRDVDIRVISDT